MKFKKLYIKILAALLILISLVNFISFFAISNNIKKEIDDRMINDAYLVLQGLNWAMAHMEVSGEVEEIKELVSHMTEFDLVKSLKVISLDGKVKYTTDDEKLSDTDIDVLNALLSQDLDEYHVRHFETNELITAIPMTYEGRTIALLLIHIDEVYENQLIRGLRHDYIYLAFITTVFILVSISVVLYLLLSKPLGKFQEALYTASRRDYSKRIPLDQNTEFQELAVVFNRMLSEIESHTKELVHAKDIAEKASASQSVFLSNMSHEFLTPLHSILGFTDLLREEETSSEKLRKIDAIKNSGEHLKRLISDVLDVSELKASHFDYIDDIFRVNGLVDALEDWFKAKTIIKGIAFDVVVEDMPEMLRGDEKRIEQLLMNIVGNSIKFTEEGFVKCVLSYREPYFIIRVIDSGIGISQRDINRIYDAFSKKDTSMNRVYGGLGLGLTISREIINAYDGHMNIESQLGTGTTFDIKLKLKAVQPQSEVLLSTWLKNEETQSSVETFIGNLPDYLNQLDGEDKKDMLHQLKGTAANLKMDYLYKKFESLEGYLVKNQKLRFDALLQEIREFVESLYLKKRSESSERKLLLLEDSESYANQIMLLADSLHINYNVVNSNISFMETLFTDQFDIIIINVNVKEVSTDQVLAWIRKQNKEAYVIALIDKDQEISQLKSSGYDWFVSHDSIDVLLVEKLKALKEV